MTRNCMPWALLSFTIFFSSCSSFKAKRVDAEKSDEKAMTITDQWVAGDTDRIVKEVMDKVSKHAGLKRYMARKGKRPRVFIGEVQNLTSDAYFPINDINDQFLDELSSAGDFVLVDAQARDAILQEITYQQDGMVDPKTAKNIGKQTGADLMIFGNMYMRPQVREGKTLKEFSFNLRMTDLEKAEEVLRVRSKLYKYSERSGSKW